MSAGRLLRNVMVSVLLTMSMGAHAANPSREFVASCTYGVMAGTLVGAASLAFSKKPGDDLHRVARGASLGLYTGILLGLYVVYVVPKMEHEEEDPVALMISPTENEKYGIDGMRADWTILQF